MTEKPPRAPRGGMSNNGGAWWRENEKPPRFTFKLPAIFKKIRLPKRVKKPPTKQPGTLRTAFKPKPPPEVAAPPKPPRPRKRKKQTSRHLIITADDFGASIAVNAAVEQAHRSGVLTAASLMMAGDAVEDAVARARAMPDLGVGLHIVLVEGRSVLPHEMIPDLVDADGYFRTDMAWLAAEIFFRSSVRAQVYDEIEAQFEAFAATGLPLDHVNAHKHFHVHPTIAGLILEIGAHYGISAARVPIEPIAVLNAIEPTKPTFAGRLADHYANSLAGRMRQAWITAPDQVFGIAWSGTMTRDRLAALIDRLPKGLSEIYMHPATGAYPGSATGYLYAEELAALIDPAIRSEIAAKSIELGNFADFVGRDTA